MELRDYFGRRGAAQRNQLNQSCSELLGIVEGLLADGHLLDAEIGFLQRWLEKHDVISCDWPGDVLHARVKSVLADNIVTEEERAHLVKTLTLLVGGHLDRLAEAPKVNELALDDVDVIEVPESLFCLTGEFAYAQRETCIGEILSRGGRVSRGVTKKIDYLVIGGLGSDEWKHGSYGTKITKAIEYKRAGCPILIVHEDVWARCLRA